MLTDVEQKAVEGSTLGGKSKAEDGNDEYQVAGIIGDAASKLANSVLPQNVRDRASKKIMGTILGDTGSKLNKARIKVRDELGQMPLPTSNNPNVKTAPEVEQPVTAPAEVAEPVVEEPATVIDTLEATAPPVSEPVVKERFQTEDRYLKYTTLGDDVVDAVMRAPEKRDALLAGGLTDFNSNKIPDANGVQERIEAISRAYEGSIDEAKRGVMTNEVSRQLADLIGADKKTMADITEAVLNRRRGEGINVKGLGVMESMLAARDLLVGEIRKLDNLADLAEEGGDAALASFRYQLEFVANLQTQVKGAQTEYARTLQSFNIPARDPSENSVAETAARTAQDYTKLLEGFGGPDSVRLQVKAYQNQPTLDRKAKVARGLSKRRMIGNAVYEVWQHALLTNPVSQTKNIVSGIYTTFIAPNFELGGGYLIGAARRNLLKQEGGVELEELQAQVFGQFMSLQEAFLASGKAFREGALPGKIEATNVQGQAAGTKRVPAFSGEAFGKAGNWGTAIDVMGTMLTGGRVAFRSLEAGDTFFKVVAGRGELYKLAVQSATARGKTGDNLVSYIAEFVSDPPAAALEQVDAIAKMVTLQTELDQAGKAINHIAKLPLLRYFAPFIKTPYNAAKYAFVDRTPLGLLWGNTRRMIDEGGAQKDEAYARVGLGTAVGATSLMMVATGQCSGGGPAKSAMRTTLRESGDWQPYSCKVGDQWVSYAGLEPLSSIIGLWADVGEIATASELTNPDFKFKNVFQGTDQQLFKDDFTYDELVIAVLGATLYNVSNKSFMQNFASFASLVQDPAQNTKSVAGNFERSMVPRIFDQIRKTGVPLVAEPDPVMRDVRGFLDRLKSQIPGLSDTLKPSVDAWGEDKVYGVAALNGERNLAFGPDIMSPFKVSPAKKRDVITEERIRLGGIAFRNNSDEISIPVLRKPVKLTDEMKYFRNKTRGQIAKESITTLINSDVYQELKKISMDGNQDATKKLKLQLQNAYIDAKEDADDLLLQHEDHGPIIKALIETMAEEQLKPTPEQESSQ